MGIPQSRVRAEQCDACSGPGAMCAEAQADGVPCSEIRACEKCGRALPLPVPVLDHEAVTL